MRRVVILILLVLPLFTVSQVAAQDNFYDEFKQYAEDEIQEVGKPIVQAFGMAVGGGLYHTAKTHGVMGFDLGVRTMIVLIPEGKSAIMDSADISFFPVPVVQASVGLPMDFEVMLRGFSVTFEDENISLFGAGLKKNFKPMLPVPGLPQLSAMIAFHKFKAGDVIDSQHWSFDLMASKGFVFITPYIGVGVDVTRMTFAYTYVYDDPTLGHQEVPVESTVKASSGRLTLGFNLSPLPFVKLFADYNIGKYSQVTAGLAVSIR